jgi:hypothetical protein
MAESKGEIIKKKVVVREPGYLYFINKDGDACRVKMKKHQKKKVEKKVEKEED